MTYVCKRSAVAILVLAVSFGCFQSAAFASINITNAYTWASVVDFGFSSNYQEDYSLSGALLSPALPGFLSTYDNVYGPTEISHTTSQFREGGQYDRNQVYSYVNFTALNNEAYSISGRYSNNSGLTTLEAHLVDQTANAFVFRRTYSNDGAATFDLEGFGLNGSLIAGHNYEWYFFAQSRAGNNPDGGATASGFGSIQFGNAVPEPTSILIWGSLGLVGLVSKRRRRVC